MNSNEWRSERDAGGAGLEMIREIAAEESHLAYLAMLQLRPRIGSESEFVDRVNRLQRPEGYRLVAAFVDGEDQAAAVAGFRIASFLAWGRVLYCDDLSSRADHRRKGHAGALIDWMIEEARRLGCDGFHLDSGVVRERWDAHRLYMNKRMAISAYHFSLEL
jgi:GNAT superfamily N-acetyltransferase